MNKLIRRGSIEISRFNDPPFSSDIRMYIKGKIFIIKINMDESNDLKLSLRVKNLNFNEELPLMIELSNQIYSRFILRIFTSIDSTGCYILNHISNLNETITINYIVKYISYIKQEMYVERLPSIAEEFKR